MVNVRETTNKAERLQEMADAFERHERQVKTLKDRFHKAVIKGADDNECVYTFEMLQALCEMARADVYPDSWFGDTDCAVWSLFHEKERPRG